jgi:hypothetical protein
MAESHEVSGHVGSVGSIDARWLDRDADRLGRARVGLGWPTCLTRSMGRLYPI